MIFIVGGAYQGKYRYAREHFPEYEIINNYHLKVWDEISSGLDSIKLVEEYLDGLIPEGGFDRLVIISNELGYGLVPVDKLEREYREQNGRVNCYLAKRADEVYRVISGIGTRIK